MYLIGHSLNHGCKGHEAVGLKAGDQVVYYGVPGTCTPSVEQLAFALRSLDLEQVFVPLLDEGKACTLR